MTIRRMFVVASAGITLLPLVVFALGSWSTKSPLQYARFEHHAAELNGNVYVAGYQIANPLPMEVYNPALNAWSSLPTVGNVSLGTMVAINGKLYYAGGCLNADCNSPSNALRIYDPVTNTWSTGAPMPTSRGDAVGGVINGKFYMTTGVSDSSGSVPHPELTIYDPLTNTWSFGAPIPLTRRGASAAVVNNVLYVIGGGTPTTLLNNVSVYDPSTNTWTTDTPLPDSIAQATASVLNGKIHLLGGGDATNSALNTNYTFDPTTHVWSLDVPMPTARILFASATVGNTLYAIGGLKNGVVLNTVEALTETLAPSNKDQCKKDGWKKFTSPTFKNQGDCISWVNHHS